MFQMLPPHPSGTSKKKLFSPRKIMKSITFWISSVSFIISFNKAGNFLCFRRQAKPNKENVFGEW